MQPGPIALGWIVAAALLFAEHMAMWDQSRRIDAPWNYLIGVLTLAVGWIVWGLTASGPITPIDAVANIGAVTSSGGVVLACYLARAIAARRQKQAETVATARQITQEIIDNGGAKHARESRIHDPSRNN